MGASENQKGVTGLDSESHQIVIDTVRQLKKRLLTPDKIREFDKKEIFPEEVIREMLGPDIGLQLIFIPEEYGGMGGGARDFCAVTREMAKICLGIATGFFAIHLGADPILVGATDAQKEKWLGKIAEGNTIVGYAVTEPGAGSNVAALKTKAEPVNDEAGNIKGYIINGTKQFISNGGYADFVTLLANTPDGPAFFVVEKGMPGFELGKGEEKHGIRASNTSPMTLADVYVPAENLVGGIPGVGLKQANMVFGYTRLMVGSMALGAGESALSIAIAYAKERIQFNAPLSEKQGYSHKLIVPHAVRIEAATAYIHEIALRLDSGEEDLQVEGAIAKLFASESSNRAADDAIQALGGYGYITEYGVEKIKRDVKITCIYEGTSEIQQNIISTFRWKKTRKSKGEFYKSMAAEMEKLNAQYPDLGCRYYGLSAIALNHAINLAHDTGLTRKQAVMFALADMMTHVEVGISMARKAAMLKQSGDPESEKICAMSRIFANEVSNLIAKNAMNIATGSGILDAEKVSEFMKSVSCNDLMMSGFNVLNDMDKVADILFERQS